MTTVFTESVDEAFEAIGADRIDETAGIVKGVKLLGLKSKNRRDYNTPGVRRGAVKMLENAPIYIDHPDMSSIRKTRSYRDKFGHVMPGTVSFVEGQGYFGDIRYNTAHHLASTFLFDVKHAPKTLGMSINGDFRSGGTNPSGDVLVEELLALRSVDLVTSPATTAGLFEHEEEKPMTLEELKAKHPELYKQALESAGSEADQQKALEAEKARAKVLEDRLAAIEAEQALAKKKGEITAEIEKAFEGVEAPEGVVDLLVECACRLEDRKPLIDAVSKLSPYLREVPDSEEDETADDPIRTGKESVDEEPPVKGGYTPGKKKTTPSSSYGVGSLLKSVKGT
jgi:hypothetical protein